MSKLATILLGASVVLLLSAMQEQAESQSTTDSRSAIAGTVADEKGRPVHGAVISNFWLYPSSPGQPIPHDDPLAGALHAVSDNEGRFELVFPAGREPALLFAMDARRRRGGVVKVNPDGPIDIVVRSLVSVRGRCASSELAGLPRDIGGAVMHASGRQIIDWRVNPGTGAFELPLPPGDYRLLVMSTEARTWKKDIAVPADKTTLDLRLIDLVPSILARHYGKPPPAAWKVTATRGVERSVELADFRGKWVLLEFWGFW